MGGGGGGGKGAQQQLMQQQMLFAQQESALSAQQAAQQQAFEASAAATRTQIQNLFASANGQTPAAQAASKLSVLDFIHTSPQGLLNKPTTGQLNLLGN
jgi:hypothetical protein